MNKKLFLFGGLALAGYVGLTAFGPKQDAQKKEIEMMVTTKLNELRAEKEQACTDQVTVEAKRRYDEMAAAVPEAAPAPATPKKTVKKGNKGPKVDPLPQPSAPPKDNTQAKKDKMEGTPNTQEKQEKMAEPAPNTDKKKAKIQGGGGN